MMLSDVIALILISAGFFLSYKLGELRGLERRTSLTKHRHHTKPKYRLPARRY